MKDLQPNILDDFEHRIIRTMERHGNEPDFPTLEASHVTREQLDSYLFDYQSILDSEGTQRAQQTFYGIVALVPVIVISAFPLDSLPWRSETTSLLVSIVVGVAVALLLKGVRVLLKRRRLGRLKADNPEAAALTEAIERWA